MPFLRRASQGQISREFTRPIRPQDRSDIIYHRPNLLSAITSTLRRTTCTWVVITSPFLGVMGVRTKWQPCAIFIKSTGCQTWVLLDLGNPPFSCSIAKANNNWHYLRDYVLLYENIIHHVFSFMEWCNVLTQPPWLLKLISNRHGQLYKRQVKRK